MTIRHREEGGRRPSLTHLTRQLETITMLMQDVLDKLAALDAAILALPKPAPPVVQLATQEQIDAAAAAVDKASADLTASQQA